MSKEATIACQIQMQGGNLGTYTFSNPGPVSYQADVSATGGQGPLPGSVPIVSTGTGTTVSLSGLTAPGGFAFVRNLDASATISIGQLVSAAFYPIIDLLPGEFVIIRFAAALTGSAFQAKASAGTPYLEVLAHNK